MRSRTLLATVFVPASLSVFLLASCSDGDSLPLDPSPATLSAPVFDLATASDGSILVAEVLQGVTELREDATRLVASLGGVAAIAVIDEDEALAVTGEAFGSPEDLRTLFRISDGAVEEVADLYAFEEAVNPDAGFNPVPESNPFGIALLGDGSVLVADAAGNDLLIVDAQGNVDWVAVFSPQENPAPAPDSPPILQSVPTSVAVGPDGAYYVGELTGFPGTPGMARVWRVEPGSRNVVCPGDACRVVADGFTSIMDLAFDRDGNLYVVEFDEAGWLAVEMAGGVPADGGTVNVCGVGAGGCEAIATGLDLPTAITITPRGQVWIAENSGLAGEADVHPLP